MEFSEVISGIALYDSIAMVKGFQSKGKKIKAVLDFKTKKRESNISESWTFPSKY